MDNLEKYVLNHSSCGMPRCEYVENRININCDECQRRMLTEHDAKVRADAIDELETKLVDIILGNEEFTDWQKQEISLCLECVIEQLKEQK